jgi:Uma2 family endonuclease
MATEITKKLFTVDEYHRMAEAGILGPEERLELIDGEIIQMSPIGHAHWVAVNRASLLFFEAFRRNAVVSTQNSVRLSGWTEPQPDVTVFKPRSDLYAAKKPTPADVLLIVEVADSTLRFDRNVKVPLYAAAGIPEVWIEDLNNDCLLVYRDPHAEGYRSTVTLKREDSVSPIAFPEIHFTIDDLLGEPVAE